MFSPTKILNALFDFLIPRFIDGELTCPPIKIGISGQAALIPILAIWTIGIWMIIATEFATMPYITIHSIALHGFILAIISAEKN